MEHFATVHRLVVVGGDLDVQEIGLRTEMLFGRGQDVDVKLNHPLVSRQHCRIQLRGGQIVVQDLGSLNGTFIGRDRVEGEAVLPPDGLLTVGTVTFRAIYSDDGQALDRATSSRFPPLAPSSGDTASHTTNGSIEDTVRNPGDAKRGKV